MKCAHCGKRRKLYAWDVWACANGGVHAVFKLCNECDIALNRLILAYCKDPEIESKMAAYARR